MVKTGGQYLKIDQKADVTPKKHPIKPSIHDYEGAEEAMEPQKDESLKVTPAEKPLSAPTITKSGLNLIGVRTSTETQNVSERKEP